MEKWYFVEFFISGGLLDMSYGGDSLEDMRKEYEDSIRSDEMNKRYDRIVLREKGGEILACHECMEV